MPLFKQGQMQGVLDGSGAAALAETAAGGRKWGPTGMHVASRTAAVSSLCRMAGSGAEYPSHTCMHELCFPVPWRLQGQQRYFGLEIKVCLGLLCL